MSCNYISMDGGHKVARPITSLEEYMSLRNSPGQVMTLQMVRGGDEKAKFRLAQFNYSGHYPNGVVKGNKLPSKAFGFDVDDPEEAKRVSHLLLNDDGTLTPMGEKLGLLMHEVSARMGSHSVFRREMSKTILENQVRVARELDCELDTNTHDINRVYFTTSGSPEDLLFVSPELFTDAYVEAEVLAEARVLEDREKRGLEVLPPGAHGGNKHYKPSGVKGSGAALMGPTDVMGADGTLGASALSGPADVKDINVSESEPLTQAKSAFYARDGEPLTYLGIEYSQIIKKWWYLYNNGMEPCPGNRNTLTFELAVNLRHICGFDRVLMDKVIPNYWATDHSSPFKGNEGGAEKLACIDSALSERRTQMPARLKNVLAALRQENLHNAEIVSAIDEAQLRDDSYYYTAFPKGALAMGMADSVGAVGPTMVMPIIAAVCPYVGALATDVQIEIHGKFNSLNLISYISGEFASGKGDIDPVVEVWGSEIQAMDDLYLMQEDEWRAKKRKAKNAKEQPEEPRLPIRILPLNNTVANLAERLSRTQGKHAISYTPEADTVATKWKSSMSDFSVMLRQAYDASRYDREARSADAVNVHIKNLRWNVVMCGTPDALYRVVSNYTDGFQSRIAVARTPDNTFAPLDDDIHVLTDRQAENIRQVAHLLTLLSGKVKLPKLEKMSREWVENVRLDSLKDNDRVMARQRMRVCVTAMRMTACLMLCQVCEKLIRQYGVNGAETRLRQTPDIWMELMSKAQTTAMLQAYDVIADMLLDNNLYFFRDRIEQAFQSRDYVGQNDRRRRGKNDTIFSLLGAIFSFEQAYHQAVTLKGNTVTANSVRMMLKNWTKQGLVSLREDGMYVKLA